MTSARRPEQYLEKIRSLNVYRRGERSAPHKPLLLLGGIGKLLSGQQSLAFGEVESLLAPLLASFAPPVKGRHQPELPYWYLRNDGLWEVPGAGEFNRQKGGFPMMEELRSSSGTFENGFADLLVNDPGFRGKVILTLLRDHFPESLYRNLLEAVGLDWLILGEEQGEGDTGNEGRRRRDPNFRQNILTAYEHCCAVSDFRLALGGAYFGCEAAHVQWHAYQGPDTLENGFAVEPTLHKLFDAGAWSLSDERQIIFSAELTGEDEAIMWIRGFHGKALRKPLPGHPEVSIEYIRWHRDPDLGGVFRHPAPAL